MAVTMFEGPKGSERATDCNGGGSGNRRQELVPSRGMESLEEESGEDEATGARAASIQIRDIGQMRHWSVSELASEIFVEW